jgi:hypothetical protein
MAVNASASGDVSPHIVEQLLGRLVGGFRIFAGNTIDNGHMKRQRFLLDIDIVDIVFTGLVNRLTHGTADLGEQIVVARL